ncbi:MAG TPA: amidohydrolase family protein [Thermoanaerobaculia bacterium]|nr:amidohydrolase family protein [Thermoanaerobaculia bacterium]
MNLKPFFLLLALPLAAHAEQTSETRYVMEYGGQRAGSAVTRVTGQEWRYSFEYTDRGRGPKIEQRVMVGEGGLPVLIEITGYDYWKSPVDERFELKDGKAAWRNTSEKQEGLAVTRPSYYLTMNGAPPEVELLARALLAAPDRTLDMLPSGKGTIDPTSSTVLEAGGKKRKVDLYTVSGLGFEPFHIWLDEDERFFGADWGWTKIAQEGWEGTLPKLKEIQDALASKLEKERAARLTRKPAGPLVFRNARLFDPATGKVTPGTTVVISGNRIQAVGADGEVQVPAGAEVIDAAGKTLMPGLWDMHAHMGSLDGLLNLAAGVTTVRDLANDTDFLLDLRKRIDAGEILGTRIIMAGFMDGPGPYAGPTKVLVDTEEEALAAVDNYAKLGYEQIKLYSSLDTKLVPAIVERAHAKGMRVSGHIPNGMSAEQAVRAGFDEIQHANFLLLNFLEGVDTRTPERFHAIGERAQEIDLESERVKSFLALLKEKGTVADPTLGTFEEVFIDRVGVVRHSFAAVAERLPPTVQRGLLGGSVAPKGKEERYRKSFDWMKGIVKALHDNGIPIVAGTDNMAGFALHRELELYVEAGIPAVDALRNATIVPARVMKRDKEMGTVAPGKLADVILIAGDPTADIKNIRRVVLTVRDGLVFDPAKLYGEIGVKPAA